MSALGQKQAFAVPKRMSALPPKADICSAAAYARFGPKADIASYSMISLARERSEGGTVRPSALAVLRLIAISNLVALCTGRSAGLSPLRIRSTYPAACRCGSIESTPYEIKPPSTKAKFRKRPCPLYPRKRTCAVQRAMSALGQKRTHAPQQTDRYSITSS